MALKDYTIVTSESVTGEELERKRGEGKSCLRNCIEKKASKQERKRKEKGMKEELEDQLEFRG